MNKWTLLILLIVPVAAVAVVMTSFGTTGPEYVTKSSTMHEIKMTNDSQYTISPGVLVVHNNNFSMNFLEQHTPLAYESLAEVGDPSAVIESLESNENIYEVVKTNAVPPGNEVKLVISGTGRENAAISYMAMIVETNDGIVWLNGIPLHHQDGKKEAGGYWTEILDMGTEQNSPIGSGFAGGQPDVSRGAENIDNGVPTNDLVSHHPQILGGPSPDPYILRIDFMPSPVEETTDKVVQFKTTL